MYPIQLTECGARTGHKVQELWVNPETIEWFGPATDSDDYKARIHTIGGFDLFVQETAEEIGEKLQDARNDARWQLEKAIATGIVDSR